MPRKPKTEREAIIALAGDLADRVGFERFTLAEIAAALDLRLPSLYNHVASLDDVRRGVVLLALRRITADLRAAAGERVGDEAIRALADAYRAFARAHPGLYAAFQAINHYLNPEVIAAGDALVAIIAKYLVPYHLHDEDALHAIRALRSIVHGFVSLELGQGFGLPLDLDETYRRLITIFLEGIRCGP